MPIRTGFSMVWVLKNADRDRDLDDSGDQKGRYLSGFYLSKRPPSSYTGSQTLYTVFHEKNAIPLIGKRLSRAPGA